MHCWNIGNAKSREGDGYNWTNFRCWEVIKDRKTWFDPPHPQTRFRAFDTLEEGAVDYLKMLHERFFLSWPAVESGDPKEFAHLLKRQGYYTADEGEYASALNLRFNTYRKTIRLESTTIEQRLLSKDSPFKTPASKELSDTRAVQWALTQLGFDVGTVDGKAGPRTTEALKAFQRMMGLTPDGIMGPLTKAKLLEAWQAHG